MPIIWSPACYFSLISAGKEKVQLNIERSPGSAVPAKRSATMAPAAAAVHMKQEPQALPPTHRPGISQAALSHLPPPSPALLSSIQLTPIHLPQQQVRKVICHQLQILGVTSTSTSYSYYAHLTFTLCSRWLPPIMPSTWRPSLAMSRALQCTLLLLLGFFHHHNLQR